MDDEESSRNNQRDEDCRSVRSFPLLDDDDYCYCHGAQHDKNQNRKGCHNYDCDEDDGDDEPVDHVGALVGPSFSSSLQVPAQKKEKKKKEKGLRISVQSQASEMTCDDWSTDSNSNEYSQDQKEGEDSDDHIICIEDFVRLKVRVAELESQLQLHHRHGTLVASLKDLQDRELTLECENIGLKQMLQRIQEDIINERHEARRVKNAMQEKMSNLKNDLDKANKKNETLEANIRRLRHQRQSILSNEKSFLSSRRVSTNDMESSYPGESSSMRNAVDQVWFEYEPFPTRSRRASTGERPNLIRYLSNPGENRRYDRRPSLLEVLRSPFTSSSSSGNGSRSKSNERSRAKRTLSTMDTSAYSDDASHSHESWAAADEIIIQTELFNQRSGAKLLAKMKDDVRKQEDRNCSSTMVVSHYHGDATLTRPQYCRSKFEYLPAGNVTQPRPKMKRRNSFDFLRLRPRMLLNESERDEEFDVNSVLWDNNDDEEDNRTVTSFATKRSMATVGF